MFTIPSQAVYLAIACIYALYGLGLLPAAPFMLALAYALLAYPH